MLLTVQEKEPPVAEATISLVQCRFPRPRRRHTGKSLNGVQVAGRTLAEDEGGGGVVLGGVGDGVGLASNDAGREGVDSQSGSSSDEGSAREDSLEETHIDGDVEAS